MRSDLCFIHMCCVESRHEADDVHHFTSRKNKECKMIQPEQRKIPNTHILTVPESAVIKSTREHFSPMNTNTACKDIRKHMHSFNPAVPMLMCLFDILSSRYEVCHEDLKMNSTRHLNDL